MLKIAKERSDPQLSGHRVGAIKNSQKFGGILEAIEEHSTEARLKFIG